MNVYTSKQWAEDGSFKAAPGQEIEEAVYNELFNVMPPLPLPRVATTKAQELYNIPVHAGFMMGEPQRHDEQGALFLAFGRNNYGKGEHYFYLGQYHREKYPTGDFYMMECMNAFVDGRLIPAADFGTREEAVRMAANYEATLYYLRLEDGHTISKETLYTPQFL